MVTLTPACADDVDALVALRIAAMRESLERVGRFDPERARQRFVAGFEPGLTRHVILDGERVGFVVVRPSLEALVLDHLYVHPRHQGKGIGSAVLALVLREADVLALPIRVGALRGSDSNRFYVRHGFIQVEESEWDIYYVRAASGAARTRPSCLSSEQAIAHLAAHVRGRSLIAIDGLPLSGKSTLAVRIARELGFDCMACDDFVRPPSDRPTDIAPAYPFPFFRGDEMRAAIRALRTHGACAYRTYDWDTQQLGSEVCVSLRDRPFVIEGTGTLDPELAPLYDLRLFLVSDANSVHTAKLAREGDRDDHNWRTLYLPSVTLYMATHPEHRADLLIAGRGAST